MKEYMEIGKVINTHGIKGELKVNPSTDDITRFELLDKILLEKNNKLEEFTITSVRYFKHFVLLMLESIDDMTKAEKLKNSTIKIPRELALPLEDDEYYIGDLQGIEVVTKEGERLGKITEVIFTGSNDVYAVKDDSNPKSKELLIPAIKDCIIDVNLEDKVMIVDLLDGLREL